MKWFESGVHISFILCVFRFVLIWRFYLCSEFAENHQIRYINNNAYMCYLNWTWQGNKTRETQCELVNERKWKIKKRQIFSKKIKKKREKKSHISVVAIESSVHSIRITVKHRCINFKEIRKRNELNKPTQPNESYDKVCFEIKTYRSVKMQLTVCNETECLPWFSTSTKDMNNEKKTPKIQSRTKWKTNEKRIVMHFACLLKFWF